MEDGSKDVIGNAGKRVRLKSCILDIRLVSLRSECLPEKQKEERMGGIRERQQCGR